MNVLELAELVPQYGHFVAPHLFPLHRPDAPRRVRLKHSGLPAAAADASWGPGRDGEAPAGRLPASWAGGRAPRVWP